MPTGLPPVARDLDRAALTRLLDTAAPQRLPATEAIALLQRVDEDDPAVFGVLAYRALTGVEPGDIPLPPKEVVPGFPPFASEMLYRAVAAAAARRPTASALLIVLETVPASSWPPAEGAPVDAERAPVDAEGAPVDAEGAPVDVEGAPIAAEEAMFNREGAGPAPVPAPTPPVAARPAMHEEFRDIVGASIDDPRFDPVVERDRPAMHEEFRNIVGSSHDVPRFDRLGGAGTGTTRVAEDAEEQRGASDREHRHNGKRKMSRRARRGRDKATQYTSTDDRRQTLVVVAMLAVLIAIGVLYVTLHDGGTNADPSDESPQGARTSLTRPWDVAS